MNAVFESALTQSRRAVLQSMYCRSKPNTITINTVFICFLSDLNYKLKSPQLIEIIDRHDFALHLMSEPHSESAICLCPSIASTINRTHSRLFRRFLCFDESFDSLSGDSMQSLYNQKLNEIRRHQWLLSKDSPMRWSQQLLLQSILALKGHIFVRLDFLNNFIMERDYAIL